MGGCPWWDGSDLHFPNNPTRYTHTPTPPPFNNQTRHPPKKKRVHVQNNTELNKKKYDYIIYTYISQKRKKRKKNRGAGRKEKNTQNNDREYIQRKIDPLGCCWNWQGEKGMKEKERRGIGMLGGEYICNYRDDMYSYKYIHWCLLIVDLHQPVYKSMR